MGQQQILLIVLSVILVGIAVAVGINMFNQRQNQSEIDTLVTQLTNAGTAAYQFYLKPTSLGGAGRSANVMNSRSAEYMPALQDGTHRNGTVVADGDGTTTVCTLTAQTPTATSNKNIVVTLSTNGDMTTAVTDYTP